MPNVKVYDMEEVFQISYITMKGWVFEPYDGWVHPKKKPYKLADEYEKQYDYWDLESAYWEAYQE